VKKVGFIGGYDKSNFLVYLAKAITLLNNKVLVIDTTIAKKTKYIVPTINLTKTYMTTFENIDFAIGYKNTEELEEYIGEKLESKYDYVLVDIDRKEMLENFDIDLNETNYFVTGFDMYSLKRGMTIFQGLNETINLTKILFVYERLKENEDYLSYISMEYNINWNEYTMYFNIYLDDIKIIEENQRLETIQFKRLSIDYKDSIACVVQDIMKNEKMGNIKKVMRN